MNIENLMNGMRCKNCDFPADYCKNCYDEKTRLLELAQEREKLANAQIERLLEVAHQKECADLQLTEAKAETAEACAKIVDSFDTSQWSDTQRNVVRIIAHQLRESFAEKRVESAKCVGSVHIGGAPVRRVMSGEQGYFCSACGARLS